MPEVEYLHICDYAFPADGGKPCIIGIFDVIGGTQFPLIHPVMNLALQLRGTALEQVQLTVEVGRPNGDVLIGTNATVSLNEAGSAFINMGMMNAKFPEPGRYTVKVRSGGQTLASRSFTVRKAPPTGHPPLAPQSKVH